MIPTECRMPNLSDMVARPLTPRLLACLMAYQDRNLSVEAGLHRRVLVRLIDKAGREYELAREAAINQLEHDEKRREVPYKNDSIIFMFGFVDHIETCLNAVARIIRILGELSRDQTSPEVPRIARTLLNVEDRDIRRARHTVEHLEERIAREARGPVLLRPDETMETVTIAEDTLKLASLARVIRKAQELAIELMEHSRRPEQT